MLISVHISLHIVLHCVSTQTDCTETASKVKIVSLITCHHYVIMWDILDEWIYGENLAAIPESNVARLFYFNSSSDDNCTNHFTPNQVARMHCYLDLVYQKWLTDRQPASVSLAPIVTDQSQNSVSLYWLPPMRGPLYQRYNFFTILVCFDVFFSFQLCLNIWCKTC